MKCSVEFFFVLMRELDHLYFESCFVLLNFVSPVSGSALQGRKLHFGQHKFEFKLEEAIPFTRSLSGIGRTFIRLWNSCFALISFTVGAWLYPGGHRRGGRNTPWTYCQLISHTPFTHTLTPVGIIRLSSQPNVYGNGLWKGAGVPWRKPTQTIEHASPQCWIDYIIWG